MKEGSRKGGMQEGRSNSRDKGCRKGGIQEMRDTKFGSEMVQISEKKIRDTSTVPIFYLRATAMCANFLSLRQGRGGTKNGANAQHWCL